MSARAYAADKDLPYLALEDGLLRSYGLGVSGSSPLSLVVDDVGIYYDATRPSRLENLLNAGDFTPDLLAEAERALEVFRREGLSKYNVGRGVPEGWFEGLGSDTSLCHCERSGVVHGGGRYGSPRPCGPTSTVGNGAGLQSWPEGGGAGLPRIRDDDGLTGRVLVVDQTAGDASIRYGLASEGTFVEMLEAAVRENPGAQVWVKTHPDVLAGKKQGCLDAARAAPGFAKVQWIAEDWHPHSLLRHFDRVYVVTSQMGFDALLLGKQVTCFGMPFYAGWGLTDDRQVCERRTARRSLVELVAAAYLQYARYIKPETGETGTFFDVAEFIARQKRMVRFWEQTSPDSERSAPAWSGRVFCFGFRYWKHAHVRPFFGEGVKLVFARSAAHARVKGIGPADRMAVWGQKDSPELRTLADELGLDLVRMEDGFLRSVGLGADFIPPMSLVFDRRGIYFDPTSESDLENLLNGAGFTPELLERARHVRERICTERITKYNIERDEPLHLETGGRRVILVPGQVEDDASIVKGAGNVRTNAGLLRAARESHPDAFIIYKPHPDVLGRNRRGAVSMARLQGLCDHVESRASVIRCIEACDEVHTMTSLTGFDALLRGKKVVTYGAPFYAGWGLTKDQGTLPRRHRSLRLEELVAGALLLYPRYWDQKTGGFVACETTLQRLIERRDTMVHYTAVQGIRRQLRKWTSFAQGIWDAWRAV